MGRAPRKPPETDFDQETLAKICRNCGWGSYKQHPEQPHKYLKCPICGHTKEILEPHKPVAKKD